LSLIYVLFQGFGRSGGGESGREKKKKKKTRKEKIWELNLW
jgi:hypothetical protein